jgi:phosphoserine phosphatase
MAFVLTLIASPAKAPLPRAAVDAVRRALEAAGCRPGAVDWLAEAEACDIALEGEAGEGLAAVRLALGGLPVDAAMLPAADRRKRLLVADMDSTLIGQECIDELAAAAGLGPEIAAITERAMRGEVAFEPALRQRVGLLAGVPLATVEEVLAERVSLTPGSCALVATMRAHGAHTLLVSGGFTLFAEPVAARLGIDEVRANALLHEGGRLTGRVAEPVLGRDAKEAALEELLARLGLSPQDALAVGDGANDAGMLRLAGLGVAFHAKPTLKEVADAIVDHADLTALLYLQGYRRDELVSGRPACA